MWWECGRVTKRDGYWAFRRRLKANREFLFQCSELKFQVQKNTNKKKSLSLTQMQLNCLNSCLWYFLYTESLKDVSNVAGQVPRRQSYRGWQTEDTTLKTPPLSPWSTKLPEDGEHTGKILPLFYIFFTSATQTSCCKEKQKDWGTRLDEPLIWSSKGHFVPQPVCQSLYICPLFLRGKMKIKQKLFIENNQINFWKIILYKIKQSPL